MSSCVETWIGSGGWRWLVQTRQHLQAYLERTYALPGVADTVSIDHIKQGYYSVAALNPSGIVPAGPRLPWVDAS